MPDYRYAGYPSARIYDQPDGKQLKHLLWGDWVRVEGPAENGWFPVYSRKTDGFMKAADLQKGRVLEVVFVDVGQGDGCLVVTPDDRHIVIDAGVSDNMYRFLRYRYGFFKQDWEFEAAVITHPDSDHYQGFEKLFQEPKVRFKSVFHNGILEQRAKGLKRLGATFEDPDSGIYYLDEMLTDRAALRSFLAEEDRWKHPDNDRWSKRYPSLLNIAENSGRVDDIRQLSVRDGFMPGFGPDNPDLQLAVLAPVPETVQGRDRLRWMREKPSGGSRDVGKTKNGHSVVLQLQMGDIKILLGGDLNSSAETFLMQHYADISEAPSSGNEEERLAEAARPVFGSDIAKGCHHGSADFTDAFMSAVNAAATVISSGDEESHAHPRSDTLGAIGRHGRGWRPLVFSTELARSTREFESVSRQEVAKMREAIGEAKAEVQLAPNEAKRRRAEEKLEKLTKEYDETVDALTERNVTVYGAINLRCDGEKAVMAYRLERERSFGNYKAEWDIYKLERHGQGPLSYVE